MKRLTESAAAGCVAFGLLVAPFAGVAAAQSVSVTVDRWPMFRGDAALGGVARGSLADRLEPLWVFEVPEGIEAAVAIADGTVFLGALDGKLHAVDLVSGKPRWSYDAGAEIRSSPSLASGLVLFGDDDGVLHAVDAATGRRRWIFRTEAEIASSANVAGERLVFGSNDQFL